MRRSHARCTARRTRGVHHTDVLDVYSMWRRPPQPLKAMSATLGHDAPSAKHESATELPQPLEAGIRHRSAIPGVRPGSARGIREPMIRGRLALLALLAFDPCGGTS